MKDDQPHDHSLCDTIVRPQQSVRHNNKRTKNSREQGESTRRSRHRLCLLVLGHAYYNPHGFFRIVFALRGSVFLCIPHAFLFSTTGALAAFLVSKDILKTDFSEIALICGLVISLSSHSASISPLHGTRTPSPLWQFKAAIVGSLQSSAPTSLQQPGGQEMVVRVEDGQL